jgi:hypothetical protein
MIRDIHLIRVNYVLKFELYRSALTTVLLVRYVCLSILLACMAQLFNYKLYY